MALVARMKLQPTKCEFFQPTIVYMGHDISKDGVQTNGCKVKAIKNWPIPVMVTGYEVMKLPGVHKLLQMFHKGLYQGHPPPV